MANRLLMSVLLGFALQVPALCVAYSLFTVPENLGLFFFVCVCMLLFCNVCCYFAVQKNAMLNF